MRRLLLLPAVLALLLGACTGVDDPAVDPRPSVTEATTDPTPATTEPTATEPVTTEPATTEPPASETAGTEPPAPVEGPVAWIPAAASSATVVEWADLLEPDMTDDEVVDALVASREVQAPSGLVQTARLLPEVMGFGLEDLLWELSPTVDGPPVQVFAFRPEADPGALLDALVGHGFEVEERDGVSVATSEVDLGQDWVRAGLYFATTAVRDDGVVVASGSAEAVDAVLDQTASPLQQLVATGMAALGETAAWHAFITDICPALDPVSLLGDSPEEAQSEVEAHEEAVAGLAPYLSLVVGTGPAVTDPARAAFTYPSAADAAADASAREAIWADGQSVATGVPLSELFTVAGVTTEGATTVLALEGTPPSRIYDLILRRDLVWASCG